MRIGVIGTGTIGQLRARSIRENEATTLAAVLDPSRESATRAAAKSGARVCASLAEFMDVPMDAVVVSSPPHVHEEPCLEAFRRGRHVLCEKPVTNSVESTQRVVDAAIAAGRALGVGFNLRYYPAIHYVKQAIAEKRIGTLDHLRVFGGHEGLSKFRAEWQYKAPESGGGAMWDVGIHMTDVARYLLGEITEVYGVMSENVWKVPGSEDNAVAVFRNPEGIAASYQATWIEWKGYKFWVEAYGDRGMVRGAYAPMQSMMITQDSPGGRRTTHRHNYPDIIVREKLLSWHDTALRSFREELRDFLALAAGDTTVRIADGYAGLRAAQVAEAVRKSAETGEAVHLPVLGRMKR